MGAAVDAYVGFDAVSQYPAAAVGAGGSESVYGALEAVELVIHPVGGADREGLVVVVAADLTNAHRKPGYSLGGAALMSARAESESLSIARSPMERIPTGRPFSSTGTRRMPRSLILATAISILSSGAT